MNKEQKVVLGIGMGLGAIALLASRSKGAEPPIDDDTIPLPPEPPPPTPEPPPEPQEIISWSNGMFRIKEIYIGGTPVDFQHVKDGISEGTVVIYSSSNSENIPISADIEYGYSPVLWEGHDYPRYFKASASIGLAQPDGSVLGDKDTIQSSLQESYISKGFPMGRSTHRIGIWSGTSLNGLLLGHITTPLRPRIYDIGVFVVMDTSQVAFQSAGAVFADPNQARLVAFYTKNVAIRFSYGSEVVSWVPGEVEQYVTQDGMMLGSTKAQKFGCEISNEVGQTLTSNENGNWGGGIFGHIMDAKPVSGKYSRLADGRWFSHVQVKSPTGKMVGLPMSISPYPFNEVITIEAGQTKVIAGAVMLNLWHMKQLGGQVLDLWITAPSEKVIPNAITVPTL